VFDAKEEARGLVNYIVALEEISRGRTETGFQKLMSDEDLQGLMFYGCC